MIIAKLNLTHQIHDLATTTVLVYPDGKKLTFQLIGTRPDYPVDITINVNDLGVWTK